MGAASTPAVTTPYHACEHFYVVTKPLEGVDLMTPSTYCAIPVNASWQAENHPGTLGQQFPCLGIGGKRRTRICETCSLFSGKNRKRFCEIALNKLKYAQLLPTLVFAGLRDYDGFVYFREWSGGLLAGGFEPRAKPCWHHHQGAPRHFEFQLFPEDWDHFRKSHLHLMNHKRG